MRAFFLFVGLILLALFLSAAVNYPLYNLLQDSTDKGPEKLITIVGKLFAIPGFIWILYHLGIANKRDLGYQLNKLAFLAELLRGLAMGFALLGLLAVVLSFLEIRPVRSWNEIAPELGKILLVALTTGLIIGFIEETFFRGGLFAGIRKSHGFWTTAILSSVFYAWMHFINPPGLPAGESASFANSFWILSHTFDDYLKGGFWDGFIALFLLGMYLSLIRERTGNIAYVIGVHAGMVAVIKGFKDIAPTNHGSGLIWLISDYDRTIGLLSAAGMAIHLVVTFYTWRKPKALN
jgi:membrane protease YdiL (CAAX protease family)